MRNMSRLTTALLCITLLSCDQSVDERMQNVETIAEETYAAHQLTARVQHDARSLFAKTNDELRTLGFRNPDALRKIYSSRKNKPLWVTTNRLSSEGVSITKLLDEAVLSHGLSPNHVHQDKRLELLESEDFPQYALNLTDEERQLLKQMLESRPTSTDGEFATLVGSKESPLSRVKESTELNHRSTANPTRLDLLTTDALLEFGMALRWGQSAWYENYTWPDHLAAADEETPSRQLRNKRRNHIAALEMIKALNSDETLSQHFKTIEPNYEQYTRLMKAHRDYRTIVATGGWRPLPSKAAKLSLGDVDDAVKALKERLRAEGYWKGDDSAFFTQPLKDALKSYQRTHQLWEKGTVSRETLLSLNVPAQTRLSQIRVALDRWRASAIGKDEYYVFVNVPDFHLEIWRDGVREQRFKTVVGSTAVTTDDRTAERGYGFATPNVSSTIRSVIWDPYWWVPEGIETDELVPQMEDDPALMDRMGYEWAQNHSGEVVLRQKPGERNVLGRVKFEFDNKHGIYMHDTPDRTIFGWPVRAESHGCIRLQRPIDLARTLLANDMKWEAGFENRAPQERVINLSKPVPIHVEYYVVRVDDLGRVNFLADLYRKNTQRYRAAKKVGLGEEIPASVLPQ